MYLGNNIRYLRKAHGMSQEQLSEALGYKSYTTIQKWESGVSEPPLKIAHAIAALYHVDIDDLTKRDLSSPFTSATVDPPVRIPVLGSVPAGIPIEAIEDIIDWEEIPASMARGGKEYFALRVSGDSMYPKYLEGDIVIVRRVPTCDSGDDCIVYVNGYDATLKTVLLGTDGSLTIRPINANYPPRTFSKREIEELPVSIAGVVSELRRKIKG